MKLFYSPGSCSMASHIVMSELNLVYEIEAVNLKDKTCASGDFKKINPTGVVPVLHMENNEILTEGAVIMQYLCDQKMDTTLCPKFGTLERYRCMEWLNFIATDLHKNFAPLFFASSIVHNEQSQFELKTSTQKTLKNKLGYVSEKLANNEYLMGKNFTIADAYLFTILKWTRIVGFWVVKYHRVCDSCGSTTSCN